MKHFTDLIAECLTEVEELFPWDLTEEMANKPELIIVDIREQNEWDALHIEGSIHVPRGLLEAACDWDYDDTVPALAAGRDQDIVVICRSGNRSVLAAHTLLKMGFKNVRSLKTGIRGWNDFEQPLVDKDGNAVDIDDADELLASNVRPEQQKPAA